MPGVMMLAAEESAGGMTLRGPPVVIALRGRLTFVKGADCGRSRFENSKECGQNAHAGAQRGHHTDLVYWEWGWFAIEQRIADHGRVVHRAPA